MHVLGLASEDPWVHSPWEMTVPILAGIPVGLGTLAFLQDLGLGQEMVHLLRTHMWAC